VTLHLDGERHERCEVPVQVDIPCLLTCQNILHCRPVVCKRCTRKPDGMCDVSVRRLSARYVSILPPHRADEYS